MEFPGTLPGPLGPGGPKAPALLTPPTEAAIFSYQSEPELQITATDTLLVMPETEAHLVIRETEADYYG